MHRRHFLKLASTFCATAAASTTGCTHRKFYNPDQDIIIGGGRFKKGGEILNVLAIANIQQKDTQLVETSFLPNEVLIDPDDKKRIITFEKNGDHAAVIDLNIHQVTTQFAPGNSHRFSGYGTFDTSADHVYSIESDIGTLAGRITIRDSKSFQPVDSIPSYGKKPVACKLINQQLIAVANCGHDDTPASITYIDIQDNKLLDDVLIENGPVNSCHFSISDHGQLIVSSSPVDAEQTGQIAISSDREGSLLRMTQPEALTDKLFGGAYNICIDEQHDIAAISHPQANLLTFWSIKEQKLYKAMSVPNPRGVTLTLDNKNYIVSYGIDSSSILIQTKDLIAVKTSIMQPTYNTGKHTINWSKTIKEIMPEKIYS